MEDGLGGQLVAHLLFVLGAIGEAEHEGPFRPCVEEHLARVAVDVASGRLHAGRLEQMVAVAALVARRGYDDASGACHVFQHLIEQLVVSVEVFV